MNRSRRPKKDQAPAEAEALAEALDGLDQVHGAIVKMAIEAELSPAADDLLVQDDNDDLPESRFDVGQMNAGPERGGGVVLDTRLTLTLDDEQAEAIAFSLMRSIRNEDEEHPIVLELDGRFVIGTAAAKDFRRALREGA